MFWKLFATTLVAMAAVDLLWIGVVMKDFYRAQIGHLMSGSVQWLPAIIFYLVFVAGLLYFAALPGIASGSLLRTFLMGAFFGLVAYATYDLTNHATLRDWPLLVTIVDIAWGALISGALASLAFYVSHWLK